MSLVAPAQLAQMRGVLDKLTNCVLLKVEAPGTGFDEWDRPTEALTPVWEGTAKAYLGRSLDFTTGRRREGVTDADVEASSTEDTLTFLADGRATTDIVAGGDQVASFLTVRDERVSPPVTVVFRADGRKHQAHGLLDFLEIKLRDPA